MSSDCRFDSIVFDLDGTLWDTTHSCVVAWNNCILKLGIEFREIVDDDVRRVTGRSHHDCIQQTFEGLRPHQIESLIDLTATEDTETISRLGGEIYPGVAEGLERLSEHYKLFIVSNCQSGYIETFLEFSGFGEYFQDFECFGNTLMPKGHNLAQVIQRNSLRAPVMVGDAIGDEIAAKECEVPYYFVDYGFGDAEAPAETFSSFNNLVDHLLVALGH